MRRVYRFDFPVPDAAIDRNGHVNNVQYVQWMQDVAILHSDATGCMAATTAIGATWVVRSHRIEYLRPALAGDRIIVFTWVAGMRKVRSLRKYRFVRAADGEVLAQGETDWAF
ncbi:MAG: acyl-CoA thioesterase, partial [Betaproteobacteria bacterium]|nr:acyl-CoA thioesterase [Betaproteobacteria bacterium]